MTSLAAKLAAGPPIRSRLEDVARRARIALAYRWRHGRWPKLERPELFTEWVQWRKLNHRADRFARLTDKLFSKALVERRLGPGLCVPTLWSGTVLPPDPPGAFPMIVKSNHGCGQIRVVRTLTDLLPLPMNGSTSSSRRAARY